MQRFLLAKRAWVVLFGAVCGAYLYGLGAVPLLGPDEPRYAQVAREMFARGDWVTPTLGGQTWFEKPALLYWLMEVAYGLFGVTEFAARVGSALSGVLTVLLAGWAARRAEFESGEGLRGLGVTCAAVAASTLGLLVFARASSFDTLLTATVTGALACFYCSEVERGAGRRTWLVGLYIFVGASLLAKGLVGVVIPGAVVVIYSVFRRRWPGLLRLGVPWGALLALLVAAAWYGPVIARHGQAFVDEFFVQHHFARYVSNKYHHPQPFWFYLPVTLGLALPWTAFLVSGIAGAAGVNARAEDAASKLRVLALAWLLVPVLFFSASGSKLPGYVLPALPGAALLAGDGLHRYLRGVGGTLAMRLTGLLALLAFAAGVAFLVFHVGEFGEALRGLPPFYVAALLLPSGLTALVTLLTPRRRELCAIAVVGATLLTVVLVVAGGVLERATREETMGDTLAEAAARGFGGLPVVNLHTVERTSEFYAAGRLAYGADGEPLKLEGANQVAEFARGRGGGALVIVPHDNEHQLFEDPGLESKRVAFNGRHALVYVKSRQ
ncbi:MAG TPA: glycosyltransferase family 39 protein [Pyrinomonadaceae bacterium]|nr:glycosyltransferase family 39 protein [Pyrinomonadaceae bacterium]